MRRFGTMTGHLFGQHPRLSVHQAPANIANGNRRANAVRRFLYAVCCAGLVVGDGETLMRMWIAVRWPRACRGVQVLKKP